MTAKELNIIDNNEYQQWLQQLCTEIDKQRLKAAMQLNAATLQHYWWLGNDIIRQQKEQGWGAKVIDQLSVDLQKRYGNDSGYSIRNLKYMKQFAEEYPDFPFVQVPLAQIQEMPILQARLAKFTISADGEFVQDILRKYTKRTVPFSIWPHSCYRQSPSIGCQARSPSTILGAMLCAGSKSVRHSGCSSASS